MSHTTEAPATAEQKAEWSALHDRAHKLFEESEGAARVAALFLVGHVAAGGMAPGEYGVPSDEALFNYQKACERAAQSAALLEERKDVCAQIEAHPYTAELNAARA